MWSPKDSKLALTSPNDVHHSVNLSNTKFITYIYTFFITFFCKKILKHLYLNIHTTTKNIVLVLCFVTVFCHIVNRSYMLNTVQHSYKIKDQRSRSLTKKKPNCAEILNKTQLCVTELFTLFQFSSPKC